ncbi:pseudouridine synthase [Massarina eburnea CBS 473.64]|uniref:Pseudouridine synthase n=1 Tax=Massarina eburnea CBS 473.64 TaxID=1395130 RepID=A0A6A6RGZ1_9PLEO|nr:pseudouridine synthase [Massarina eburnea CBS 473.64]
MRPSFHTLSRAFPELEAHLHRLFCTRRSFHKLSRVPRRVLQNSSGAGTVPRIMAGRDYEKWTHEQLVARIAELEGRLKLGATRENAATTMTTTTVTTTNICEPNAKTFTNFPIPAPAGGNSEIRTAYRKPPKQTPKAFDASKYASRLIALKFAYLGQKYNGFEHHRNNTTPLPTIEEELWKALMKTRLISPKTEGEEEGKYARTDQRTYAQWDREGADVNWDGCEYSKCGRTDRGVSAFGQVIGVRVRSNKPLPKPENTASPSSTPLEAPESEIADEEGGYAPGSEPEAPPPPKPFNDLADELPYIQLLNRVLPPDIRIYAWCPNPPADFSARFSCKERRYKYFFTNPSFAPPPGAAGLYNTPSNAKQSGTMREGWLDIDAMNTACKSLIGLHDFRNFCKIDASKQLTNFKRRIFHADIEEISPLSVPGFLSHPSLSTPTPTAQPKLYAFTLHGSAFLWHQVRSLVSILFLIGQNLESPSLIPSLLDISANSTRPKYEMASDAPLVLWDCIFPDAEEVQSAEERVGGYTDRLGWVYVGDEGAVEPKSGGVGKGAAKSSMGRGKWGRGGVVDDVWEIWHKTKIDETLTGLLLDTIANQGQSTLDAREFGSMEGGVGMVRGGPRVFDGGDGGRAKGVYMPVLKRERQEAVEVVNERYAKRKGLDRMTVVPDEEGDE